jgi:hypothetical protein
LAADDLAVRANPEYMGYINTFADKQNEAADILAAGLDKNSDMTMTRIVQQYVAALHATADVYRAGRSDFGDLSGDAPRRACRGCGLQTLTPKVFPKKEGRMAAIGGSDIPFPANDPLADAILTAAWPETSETAVGAAAEARFAERLRKIQLETTRMYADMSADTVTSLRKLGHRSYNAINSQIGVLDQSGVAGRRIEQLIIDTKLELLAEYNRLTSSPQ